jgi:hypothetical protein
VIYDDELPTSTLERAMMMEQLMAARATVVVMKNIVRLVPDRACNGALLAVSRG